MQQDLKNWIHDQSMGDPWGELLTSGFAIADLLYHVWDYRQIPESWGYSHSQHAQCDTRSEDFASAMLWDLWEAANNRFDQDRPRIEIDDLLYAGNIIIRGLEILEAMGKSY